jgi:hypothetical protein
MENLIKNKYDILKKKKLLNIRKKVFIAISSLDRDWYNLSETPFIFKVKFDDLGNNTYTNITNNIKNIVSIKLETSIIPNKNLNITYTSTGNTLDNYPFIIVDVGNINNVIYGSNNNLSSSLAVMSAITPMLKAASENRYLEFKNLNHSIKEYYDNPIASLSDLEIKIKNPQGSNLTDIQDVLTIDTIYNTGSDSSEFLKIKTTTYFGSEYQVGDIIIIKNYVYRETDTYFSAATDFNNFINRIEGHKIISLTSSSGSSSLSHYNNLISISIPHSISTTNGELTLDSSYTELKTKSSTDDDSSSSGDTGGKLINTNLQTNLFINIEYLEKNNLIKSELI